MTQIRPPAVAGMFYPSDPKELDTTVQLLLEAAAPSQYHPRAIIAPHAGYKYSGPIAASAYRTLQNTTQIKRIILLGPSHRVAFHGLALPQTDAFATPLGQIDLDQAAMQSLSELPQIKFSNRAHATEHSLEVHLPFLQKIYKNFKLVPLSVGKTQPEEVAQVLEHFIHDPTNLIVLSSDLSHYNDYQTAVQLDRRTSRTIETLDYQNIDPTHACGCHPIQGLLLLAQKLKITAKTIDLRNSGDTAGPRDKVVGYGAYIFQ